MAGSVTQSKFGGTSPGTSVNITLDSSVTAGKKLLAFMCAYSSASNGVLTASGGGTWVTQESNGNGTARMSMAVCESATGGATTVTVSSSGTGDQYISAIIVEADGLEATAFDVDASSNGTTTAFNTGTTGTPSTSNSMVFAFFSATNTPTMQTPSGFTNISLLDSNATYQPYSLSYKSITSASAQSASYTAGASGPWANGIIVLKETGGGGGANILRQMMAHHGG